MTTKTRQDIYRELQAIPAGGRVVVLGQEVYRLKTHSQFYGLEDDPDAPSLTL